MNHSKLFYLLLITFVIFSCEKSSNANFTVKGDIHGFTKGTIYLDKVIDTLITHIDSFVVHDDGKFLLQDYIESPEIYYLRIKEIPGEELLIFGEKGTMNIKSKLDKFVVAAKVTGSENHDLLQEYKDMIQHFNNSRLDLFKANLEAEQKQDSIKLDSLDRVYKNLIRKRYLYTTNFAVRNSDKEVAPYIALTELYNANISLLDTVNNSLSEDIKNSKYGKQLDQFISVIKNKEVIE